MTELQAGLVSVTKEILATQASLTLLTGETLNLSTLTVNLIDLTLGAIVETASTVTVSQPTSISEKVSHSLWGITVLSLSSPRRLQ